MLMDYLDCRAARLHAGAAGAVPAGGALGRGRARLESGSRGRARRRLAAERPFETGFRCFARKPSEAERRLSLVAKERFRRALRGYDPEEVDAAIDARDARLARLEREAQRLAERVVERERRLQEALRKPVAAAVSKGIEEIYGQARRQATRIRMKALEDAVQMADRVTELTSLRDELGARVSELAEVARIAPGVRGGGGARDRGIRRKRATGSTRARSRSRSGRSMTSRS